MAAIIALCRDTRPLLCDDEPVLARFKILLGIGPPEAYPTEVSTMARIAYAAFLFAWMTVFFALFDAFGSDETFVEALPSAALGGVVAAVIATLFLPWSLRRFGRR